MTRLISVVRLIGILPFVACGDGGPGPDPDPREDDDPTEPGGVLILRVFDLGGSDVGGGGDAILVTDSTADGQRHVLIDAGPAGVGGQDRDFVLRRLDALGVDTLEAIILTHAHADHYLGMPPVLAARVVRNFYDNGQHRTAEGYEDFLDDAAARTGSRIVVDQLIDFELGTDADTNLRLIPPLPDFLDDPDAGDPELHDGSLAVALTRGSFRMFFAGDGGVRANVRWRTVYPQLTANLTALKVGDHGGDQALFDDGAGGPASWLEHTDPRLALVSANGTSHPRVRATALLGGRALTVSRCTHVHGELEIRVDQNGLYRVTVERNGVMACAPGSDAEVER